MYNVVVIDDDETSRKLLVNLLGNFTTINIRVLGTAENLDEGVKLIKLHKPDIVFLDVEMPGKKGFAIYDYFSRPDFKIIFVTGDKNYAVDAIRFSASDFLVKAVNMVDLRESLQKVIHQIEWEHQQAELIDRINYLSTSGVVGKNILIDVEGGFEMENTSNIEYCVAAQSYSVIVTIGNKEITVSKSLKEIQEILPENQFYRTHKSYLVNINYIRKFVKASESYVLLKSGTKIPVSVRVSAVISKDLKQKLSM